MHPTPFPFDVIGLRFKKNENKNWTEDEAPSLRGFRVASADGCRCDGNDNGAQLPIPAGLTTLSPDMDLVISDIVSGKLSQVANSEWHETSTSTPPINENQEKHFQARFDRVSGVSRSAAFEQEKERGVSKRQFEVEI